MKKDYLFYGAFGIGIVALVAVLAAYNLNSRNTTKEQSIDLNASNQEITQEADNVDVMVEDDVKAQNGQAEQDDKTKETQSSEKEQQEELSETSGQGESSSENPEQDSSGEQTAPDMDAPEDVTEETMNAGTEDEPQQDTKEQENTAGMVNSKNAYNGAQTLTWPVTGDIILPYSMDTTVYFQTLQQYKCNPGMLIAAEKGEQVCSVYAGVIKEIGNSNEFGDYLVMDLGNGYQVFYGQLEDIHVSENDQVGAGDKLASVGEPSAYFEKEGSHLYIAITKDEKPVNPVGLMAD